MRIEINTEEIARRVNTEIESYLWDLWDGNVSEYRKKRISGASAGLRLLDPNGRIVCDSDNGLPIGCVVFGESFPTDFDGLRKKWESMNGGTKND